MRGIRRPRTHVHLLVPLIVVAWMAIVSGEDQDRSDQVPVRAGTDSAVELVSPRLEDSFSFVIFGDRTTGSRGGLNVLREAVEMTNRLDPDFVMTVGDMIQGSSRADHWIGQMREYREIVAGLEMPWYPCAGNHDVYGHEDNLGRFREHFGPLYYSFDVRWAHFVVLFTDEGMSRHRQNMSPEQIEWLRQDLQDTEADQVYVFMHQPRWHYEHSNWPEVHEILKNDGRVQCIIAGHFHTWRDDGEKDGIHHYVMAATGGGLGPFQSSAQIHEISQMRIRRDGYSMAVMPVGQVHGGDMVLGAEVDSMGAVHRGGWLETEGVVQMDLEDRHASRFTALLRNPTQLPLRWSLHVQETAGWKFQVEITEGHLDPGAEVSFGVLADAPAYTGTRPDIGLVATLDYPLQSGLVQPISTRVPVPIGFVNPHETKSNKDLALEFDGHSCVRVPLRHSFQSLTLECWVKGHPPRGWCGLVSKTQQSGFSLNWADPQPDGNVRIRGHGNYVNVKTARPWKWEQWTHLAFTWDGEVARIWRNGRLEGEKPAEGDLHDNGLPLFIGADTNGRGNPEHLFVGTIDEVRVSDIARYERRFQPRRRFTSDENTVLLFHMDEEAEGVLLDSSGHQRHGWWIGQPRRVRR